MKIMSLKCIIGVFHTNMMTEEEREAVKLVYNRFIQNEDESWTGIDDNLEMCGWMSDREIVAHAKIKIDDHARGAIRCKSTHDVSICFAPRILEAAQNIIKLYDETRELHCKNKYVLEYYLVMSELNLIYINEVSSAV